MTNLPKKQRFLPLAFAALLGTLLLATAVPTQAGPLLDRIKQHILERRDAVGAEDALENPDGSAVSDSKLRVLRDIPYGNDPKQRMDVYLPEATGTIAAPVIFMVHGGGWRTGDKRYSNVVDNKANRWVAKGFVLVSVNNRLLPEADPLDQVRDVARALAAAQAKAAGWGADPKQFVLMGHSAGAHLVGLLSSSSLYGPQAGALPWLGSVLLDSAALDVAPIMKERHFKLYDPAFGTDPEFWKAASPYQQLHAGAKPMLAVCSTRREESCAQATAFGTRAQGLGVRVQTLGQDMSHSEINKDLGLPGAYTSAVEQFMGSLSPVLAGVLAR